jgi:hypothetical protein
VSPRARLSRQRSHALASPSTARHAAQDARDTPLAGLSEDSPMRLAPEVDNVDAKAPKKLTEDTTVSSFY